MRFTSPGIRVAASAAVAGAAVDGQEQIGGRNRTRFQRHIVRDSKTWAAL